jgi:flagellin
LDDLNTNTKFDGDTVFGTGSTDVQVGETSGESVSVSQFEISSSALSITQDLTTSDNALAALGEITSAIETVSTNRGTVGAKSQRLLTLSNSLGITSENIQAAESQIRDADVAAEVVNLTKFQILSQSGVSALAQANQSAQSVLSLL